MDLYLIFVKVLLSFLIGAIPFAVVSMWGTGIDITKAGSRNPGFNNVLRMGYKGRALVTLAGDISKGYIALLLLSKPGDPSVLLWGLGLAAVVGHCWNPFLRFKGGKGVATTLGVLMFLDWKITLFCLPLYPLLRLFGRRLGWAQEGAISSMTTILVISTLVLALRGVAPGILALVACAIIVVRHSANIREILAKVTSD